MAIYIPAGLTTSDVAISSGGTNNYVMTAVDDNNIQGEANLTFDGSTLTVTGAVTVGSDGSGQDVIFYSGTAGDNLTWDASEEVLQITGTDGATSLDVLDGDVRVVDKLYFYDRGGEYLSSDGSTLTITGATTITGTLASSGAITVTQTAAPHYDFASNWSVATHANPYMANVSGVGMTLGTYKLNVITNAASATTVVWGISNSGVVTHGADGAGYDSQWYGGTSGRDMLWDASDNRLEFKDNTYLSFGTGADTAMYHSGSGMKMDTDDLTLQTATSEKPQLILKNNNDDNKGAYFDFHKNTTDEADNDTIGTLRWKFQNTANQTTNAAYIYSQAADVTDATEDARLFIKTIINGTETLILYTTGAVISGDFDDTSDVALKENIETIDTGIDTVKKLRPVTFDWKLDSREASGFIAQEVEKVIPNVVHGIDRSEDPNEHKSIKTIGLLGHVTKALQESIEKIETLEAQVKELQEA